MPYRCTEQSRAMQTTQDAIRSIGLWTESGFALAPNNRAEQSGATLSFSVRHSVLYFGSIPVGGRIIR